MHADEPATYKITRTSVEKLWRYAVDSWAWEEAAQLCIDAMRKDAR